MSQKDIVLAFSGGLDTSFCVPYLQERGWAVHTVFADTGGVDADERAFIEQRAAELGVASHVTVDGGPAIWDGFVKPFVWAGEGYQGQYPLLVSDRYLIVDAALARANDLGTQCDRPRLHRHGQRPGALRSGGEGRRRLRDRRADPRNPEGTHRGARLRAGLPRAARLRRARQAEGLHDQREPARPDHVRRRDRSLGRAGRRCARLVRAARAVAARAVAGHAALRRTAKPSRSTASSCPARELLAKLNTLFAQYGVGRGLYTGDTTIGLKGRIVFEAPGLTALARRASRAGRSRADQAAEPLQARGRHASGSNSSTKVSSTIR